MTRTASTIHRTAVIGDDVELGVGLSIGPHAVLTGPLRIGDGAWIGAGAMIGAPPEVTTARMNLAWDGDLDHAGIEIGDGVVVREGVVVHQGTHRPTTVGDGTWLLNRCYVAHDVQIGVGAVVSAGVGIGGHCTIGSRANLGMNAAVHQRRVVGPGAMVGMATAVSRDVPPYGLVHGSPPRLRDVNAYALTKAGHPAAVIGLLREAYRRAPELTRVALDGLGDLRAELEWWHAMPDLRPVRVDLDPVDA